MKLALKISIILNLGLLGGLVFIWANQQREAATSALPAGVKVKPPVEAVAVSAPPIVQQAEPQPFNWSQLESADYRTYIKNLRGIGCPEATLRAIVTADVGALYRKRSQELEQTLADINNSSWSVQFRSFNSQQALKAELQKLPGEEAAEIADLLGLQPTPAQEVAMNTTPSSQANTTPSSQVDATPASQLSRSRNSSRNTPVLPLVFQNVDLHALNLNNQQVQAINDLRQSFVDAVGGLNQDPQDQAYLDRWQAAQPEADLILQGMLGIMAWETYQVLSWNN
jgi:hypothetical protein